jgi:hypothetical protein
MATAILFLCLWGKYSTQSAARRVFACMDFVEARINLPIRGHKILKVWVMTTNLPFYAKTTFVLLLLGLIGLMVISAWHFIPGIFWPAAGTRTSTPDHTAEKMGDPKYSSDTACAYSRYGYCIRHPVCVGNAGKFLYEGLAPT